MAYLLCPYVASLCAKTSSFISLEYEIPTCLSVHPTQVPAGEEEFGSSRAWKAFILFAKVIALAYPHPLL